MKRNLVKIINHKGLSMAMIASQTMSEPACYARGKIKDACLRSFGNLELSAAACLTALAMEFSCSLPRIPRRTPTPILSSVKLHKGSGHDHREILKTTILIQAGGACIWKLRIGGRGLG